MRQIHLLIPRVEEQIGGYLAEAAICKIFQRVCDAGLVTYEERVARMPFLNDILQVATPANAIFIISWGHHIPRLLRILEGQNVVYHGHSTGYGYNLPEHVPIITVSRHTMGYWGRRAPNSLLYYLPNILPAIPERYAGERDIDVLVQTRKSSAYLMKQLVPALQSRCKVTILDSWVDDLNRFFDRSKVFLYDSSEYWIRSGLTEGFGLPPIEALSRGCVVFSSLNDALADCLDPSINCHKLRCYSTQYDLTRIIKVLEGWKGPVDFQRDLVEYSPKEAESRLSIFLDEINKFFDQRSSLAPDIPIPIKKWKCPPLLALVPERVKAPLRQFRDNLRGEK